MSLNKQIITNGINLYDKVQSCSTTHDRVKWPDINRLHRRFIEILKGKQNGCRILDIGCGNAELVDFMDKIGLEPSYYEGWDINNNLLQEAQQRYPKLTFKNVNILDTDETQKFDAVIICGLFNGNMGQNEEWCFNFLSKAFEYVDKFGVLSFNAISTHVNTQSTEMFYIDPANVFNYCSKNLSERIELNHFHLAYNYTMHIYKE